MSSNNINDAASAETNNVRNVRQRANPLGLESLPDDTLLRVASYLSHTTRALLSVALTAPSSSYDLGGHNENEKDLMAKKVAETIKECGWQQANSNSLSDVLSYAIENCKITKINNNPQHQKLSKASKIVLSNPYYKEVFHYSTRIPYDRNFKYEEDWKTLDLLDLDKSLRMRLTDGDIAGILVCIDAVNNLEYIRLPHCINVRGDGLAPLRGSIVLKKADLCIVSEEVDSMTPKLSIDSVLPIFDSIMAVNQSSIKRLHVPKVWRDSHSERLNNFYLENQLLPQVTGYDRHMSKSEKRAQYLRDHPNPWDHMSSFKMDCGKCNSCYKYTMFDEKLEITCEGEKGIETCPTCDRKYCVHDHAKYEIKKCDVCEKTKCIDCDDVFECSGCGRYKCGTCTEKISCSLTCYGFWEKETCRECAVNGQGYTKQCRQCRTMFCIDCDPEMSHLGETECEACRGVDEADWHGVNH